MGKVVMSRLEKRPKRKEQKRPACQEGSELDLYFKEKDRIEAKMGGAKPWFFFLDSTALIHCPNLILDIISAFRRACGKTYGGYKIIIPLQVIEDAASDNTSEEFPGLFYQSVIKEGADLSLLPIEYQVKNRTNNILAVVAKYAEQANCILISDDASLILKARSLMFTFIESDVFCYRLNEISEYWNQRREIESGKVAENLDWGTILPLDIYYRMDKDEYYLRAYEMIEDSEGGNEKCEGESTVEDEVPISPKKTAKPFEARTVDKSIGRITKEEFLSLPIENDSKAFFRYSLVSSIRMPDLQEVYDKVSSIFEFFVSRLNMEDTADSFNTFLFRMTGRKNPDRAGGEGLLKCSCDGDLIYFLARRLNPPKKDGGAQVPNGTYKQTYDYFCWLGKPEKFDSGIARNKANSKPNKEFCEALNKIIGIDWLDK